MAEYKFRKALAKKLGTEASTKSSMTLQNIENLFVEKLSEKYRLNERYLNLLFYLTRCMLTLNFAEI